LAQLIENKTARSEGVILVERDADGEVLVTHTANALGRRGIARQINMVGSSATGPKIPPAATTTKALSSGISRVPQL